MPSLRFPHLKILQNAFPVYSPQGKKSNRLFLIFISLLWLCLTIAFMRPQLVNQLSEVENKGYDIILAVDLSGSMRALDLSTKEQTVNRLDVAKNVVSDFVNDRKNDRIGLVLFGDTAHQYAPLTLDTNSVSQMLNETVISMAGDGTAIGDAIGLAVKSLRDRPKTSRIIILLTDGEDTASSIPPMQASRLAKEYGIRIYTIGIGSKGRVPYPDQYGRVTMVEMSIDDALLNNIAQETNGRYFNVTSAKALKNVYKEIDKLEKTKSETQQYLIRTPLYRYPLGLGLVILILICLQPFIDWRLRYGA